MRWVQKLGPELPWGALIASMAVALVAILVIAAMAMAKRLAK